MDTAVIEREVASTRVSRLLVAVNSPRKVVIALVSAGLVAASGGAAYANTNSSTVKIGTVSATGFSVTGGNDATACTALIADATVADFSMADVAENQTLAASTSNISLTNNGSLVFTSSVTENQDACKGAALTITLSASAGS
jgi:hypothetical protein